MPGFEPGIHALKRFNTENTEARLFSVPSVSPW